MGFFINYFEESKMDKTKTLTIMFVDLVGYTKRTSATTREKFIGILKTYQELIKPVFSDFHGNIVKGIGDAYMVSFESPTNAVLCGVYLQNAVAEHNKTAHASQKLRIKISINTGEVHVTEDDVYGDAVNVASRLEKAVPPGRIYFTESVFLAMNRNEVSIGFVGTKRFKGVSHNVRVYTVLGKYDKVIMRIKKHRKNFEKSMRVMIALIMITILLIAAGAAVLFIVYPELLSYVKF